jgi:hypothetical protein
MLSIYPSFRQRNGTTIKLTLLPITVDIGEEHRLLNALR